MVADQASVRNLRSKSLKPGHESVDLFHVRYQRLILEAGRNAVTVRFHPRLTVIAGVGRQERELLVTELLGSLSGGRPGANLELIDDAGRRLAVLRPATGGHDRVLELETGADVTAEFAGAHGSPDVLARLGLSGAEARRVCRLTAAEMAVESQGDSLITAMASVDQRSLWSAAERLVTAENALAAESAAAGSDIEDAPLIEEIERRHAEFERAQNQNERVRREGLLLAGGCLPLALIAKLAVHQTVAATVLIAIAAATMVAALLFRRRMTKARGAEDEALSRAGKQSYIGFQLQRVDRMLDGQKSLVRVAMASEEQRRALTSWQRIAGDISPTWALYNRQTIESLSGRLQGGPAQGATLRPDLDPAELAHWLAARFTALRRVGSPGESVPLIMDDPLVGIDAGVKQWILELIGRSAGSPQVIYLTADPDVAAWARLEAMAGHLAVLEPAPDADTAPPSIVELSARS